jgi:hypothetical protein
MGAQHHTHARARDASFLASAGDALLPLPAPFAAATAGSDAATAMRMCATAPSAPSSTSATPAAWCTHDNSGVLRMSE